VTEEERDAALNALGEAFGNLKTAIEAYFMAKHNFRVIDHRLQCDEPECPERMDLQPGQIGPESLSTFVVAAELTALTESGSYTHTDKAFFGSAMATLGLLTEAQLTFIGQGHS